MTELSKGVNTALAPAGKVRIVLTWRQTPADLDITCFMVKSDGKVPGMITWCSTISHADRAER